MIRGSRLAPSRDSEGNPDLAIEPGSAQVLLVSSRWGAGGLIAIEHTWGALKVELPPSLESGRMLSLEGKIPVEYSEGHSVVNYRSERVLGSVRVLEALDDELELELDLRATEPSIDLSRQGEVRLRGTIEADRVVAQRDCF